MAEDDERTLVAQYNVSTAVTSTGMPVPHGQPVADDTPNGHECHYCGKAFNRPSSLKVEVSSSVLEIHFDDFPDSLEQPYRRET